MSPDDRLRLRHMVEAIEAAQHFVQGHDRGDLEGDRMLLFALTRAVEIVGEAASKVSDAGRTELPALPWQQIVGMRNRLIHAYFDINRNILWDTVALALPPLLAQLKDFLSKV
jgi:uncharacterized protein with HEPN domain